MPAMKSQWRSSELHSVRANRVLDKLKAMSVKILIETEIGSWHTSAQQVWILYDFRIIGLLKIIDDFWTTILIVIISRLVLHIYKAILRIQWRHVVAIVIRCSRLRLWIGIFSSLNLYLCCFNGYFSWMFCNSVKEINKIK